MRLPQILRASEILSANCFVRMEPSPLFHSTEDTGASFRAYRLDAKQRAKFWTSLALRHTQGLGLRSCKRLGSFWERT